MISTNTTPQSGRVILRSAYRKSAAAAVALLAAGVAAACTSSNANASSSSASATKAAATPTASPASSGSKPTVVLVHGAWADSTGWSKVTRSLTRAGYPVRTIANPLRGLTSDSAYVAAQLAAIPGPVVLAAHSYGGAVITNAARGAKNVKALVYIAAYAPAKGETLQTVLPPQKYPSHIDRQSFVPVPIPNAAAKATKGKDVDLYLRPDKFRDIFANDVSAANAASQAAAQRPLAGTANGEPSGDPAWKTITSYDLITLNDHAISPAGQKYMAARIKAKTATVRSAHDVMISHPADVVRIIERAAAETAGK